MQAIQNYLAEITGGRTVPRVFIGGILFSIVPLRIAFNRPLAPELHASIDLGQ